MLFHVKHTHSWEACPYHDPERARETFGKAVAGIMESDVELIGGLRGRSRSHHLPDPGCCLRGPDRGGTRAGERHRLGRDPPVVDFAELLARVTEGA